MKPKFRSLIAAFAPLSRTSLIVCASLCATHLNAADQIWNGSTSNDWNTVANWTSAVPSTGDIAVFDVTSTANLGTLLSYGSSVAGIRVADPSAPVSLGTSANTSLAPFAAVNVDNLTDTITYAVAPATPLGNGDLVAFTAGTIPGGLVTTTTYYVVSATATTFQVSATLGGAVVPITSNGATVSVNGLTTLNNATDTFAYASQFGIASPLANGNLVTFAASTAPTGMVIGRNYFVVNATATTYQVSNTLGGAAVDFTTDGVNLRGTGVNSPYLSLGASGVAMGSATQDLTLSAAVNLGSSQTWDIPTDRQIIANGAFSGSGVITKSGAGVLVLGNNSGIPGGVSVTGGQLTTRNGGALLASVLTLGNGTTYRYERLGTASTFQAHAITVSPSSSVTITTDNATNGYSGLISGDAASTVTIGGTNQCSFGNNANTQQFGGFSGTVEIADGANIRFSATSGVNNGGAAAIWDTNTTGVITARNTATVNLGSLVGSGSVAPPSNDGTATFVIGARAEDCTFGGSIAAHGTNPTTRHSALTKVGSGTLTLANTSILSYTGATNVNEGTLKINGVKSGTAATTVKLDTILAGTGSIAGTTTVQTGGTIAPGDGGVGNLTVSNLTLNNGSILNLEFGTGFDTVTVQSGSTLTLNSLISVDVNGYGTDGTYLIIPAAGATIFGTPSTAMTAINTDGSKIYSFSSDPTGVKMLISSSDPSNYWNIDGAGSWNVGSSWSKGTVPNAPAAIAKIGPGVGGLGGGFTPVAFTINLDAAQKVGQLVLNDDFGCAVTIAAGASGSLLMDNGAALSNIVVSKGSHFISAPIAVDVEDLAVDVGTDFSLDISGVISGIGASLEKSGPGILSLTGTNTYDGGTSISGGILRIAAPENLGNIAGAATFIGGTLQSGAEIAADSRSYKVAGTSNALFDTNSFNHTLTTGVSPVGGGTGGLIKSGAGTLTLSATQSYAGATAVSGGTLSLSATGLINGAGINAYAGGNFHIDGGSFTTTAGSSLTNGSDIVLNSGSATLAAVGTPSNAGDGCLIGVNGGTFTASSVTLHRTYNAGATLPTTVPTDNGFVVTNGTANVLGGVTIGTSNSSASALVSGGSLAVGGQFTVGNIVTGGRYCTLQVTGGSFTSTDAVNGVVLCTHATTANSAAVLLNGGTSTIERLSFGDNDSAADSIGALVLDGPTAALYMGAQGIVQTSPNAFAATINLTQGTLGAKASWSSSLPMNLTGGAVTIKAADASDANFDITLSGVLSGPGGFEKTGGGKLTLSGNNTYTGNTTVSAGTLEIANDDVFDDASTLTIAPGATLNLTHSGTDVVGSLVVNGDIKSNGLYTFGTGKIQVGAVVTTPFQDWAISKGLDGTAGKENGLGDDPDKDGRTNLSEFAFNGNPLSGSNNGQVYMLTADSDADSPDTAKELILTLAVRKTTPAFTAGAPATAPLTDGINYSIQGSTNLASFGVTVTPVGFVDPGVALTDAVNYEYRSFSLNGSNGLTGKGFMRANAVAP